VIFCPQTNKKSFIFLSFLFQAKTVGTEARRFLFLSLREKVLDKRGEVWYTLSVR
jgi:hypothetical protein